MCTTKFYRLNKNRFECVPEEEATLIMVSYDDIHVLTTELNWPDFILHEISIARHEIKCECYSDFFLLSLKVKNHENLEHEESLVLVKHENLFVLTFDKTIRSENEYIEIINHIFSKMGISVCENVLIPYTLTRFDTETDRAFLSELEDSILALELEMSADLSSAQSKILSIRKTLSVFKHHYLSLIDIYEDITEDFHDIFPTLTRKDYRRLFNKINRLYAYAVLLDEYVAQVHDRYRAQVDINLNQTMKIFTIISAVFMPLTLIAGWYGMNFKNMPELEAKYGYVYVSLLSLAVLFLCFLYIKRKGFWD